MQLMSSALLLFIQIAASQQISADLQKQVNDLRTRIKSLETQNDILKSENRAADSLAYCRYRKEIFHVYSGLIKLDLDFKSTEDQIEVTGLFSKMMQANNPTSDILGFRFSDVVYSSVEKYFMEIIKDENDKKRFSQVIMKIIDNPVVSSLAGSNPVTSVVTSIISAIAGFSTASLEYKKEDGKLRKGSIVQKDLFENKTIKAFRAEMQVYIDFYDALNSASMRYVQGTETVNANYANLVDDINNYKSDLFRIAAVYNEDVLFGVSGLLPDPSASRLHYQAILTSPHFQEAVQSLNRFKELRKSVDELKKEYTLLLSGFLTEYISVLGTVEDLPVSSIDHTRVQQLINDINSFINSREFDVVIKPGVDD